MNMKNFDLKMFFYVLFHLSFEIISFSWSSWLKLLEEFIRGLDTSHDDVFELGVGQRFVTFVAVFASLRGEKLY